MSTLRDGTGGPASTMDVLALDEEAAAVLEGFGYVTVVPTVEAALEELADGRFDGLLIDASNPEGAGRLERLRDGGASLPTVAFCGSDAAARTALDAGATDVVRTDSDAEGTLVGELAAVLERRDRDEADRHEAIAGLSRRALEGASPAALLERATALVADALGVDSCGAFELTQAGTLVLREGVGWEPEAVGDLTVEANEGSQAGCALRSDEPVVADLGAEDRFGRSEPLGSSAESGISVAVGPVESPWGVLGAYATDRRTFTGADVAFVRGVAEVLSGAVERDRDADRPGDDPEEVYDRVTDAFFGLDNEWCFTYLNERAEELINPEDADLLGENVWERFPDAVGTAFETEYRRAMETQRTVTFEEYYPEPLDAWFEVNAYPSETGLSVYFDEITERKEREQELELFETLVDRSTDAIYVNDPETGEFLDVNETATRHLGYSREELLEMAVSDVDRTVPDRQAWRSLVEEIRAEGRLTVDSVHRRENGSTFPAEVNASYSELEGGREYVVAVGRDATERKETTAELRRRIDQQETIADLGQRALAIDDLDALFEEATELVASVLDAPYSKVLDLDPDARECLITQGVGWRDGTVGEVSVPVVEDTQAGYTLLTEEPIITEDLPNETRFLGHDVLSSHGVVSGITVIVGTVEEPWGVLGVHDTERREFTEYDANFVQSVANVLASAIDRIDRERDLERYETIVETVNDGIYTVDETGRFTMVNRTYASMLGYDREELVGAHASLVVDDEVADAAREIGESMHAGETETSSLEATLRTASGERIEAEATFALLSEADGSYERVGVVRDITDRKRIERELRLSAETLHDLYELTATRELPFEEKLGRVLETGCERLGLEYGIFTRIEDDTMTIVQSHADHELYRPGASCPLSRSYCRRVLEEEGLVVVDDALEEGWVDDPAYETFELETYVGGQVVVGDEVYGTICFSSSEPRGEPLSEIERTFVELVNGWASYELERTENHQKLERQREQLAALDQLNAVIRDISHSILETASREEIETAVCERLAEHYRFAWIGAVERGGNVMTPTAAAGVDEGYLDGIDISLDRDDPRGRGPTAEAIRRREPRFHTNVLEDPTYEPWHEAARERGYRSSAAIPIQHEGSLYGVLNVYSPCPEAFDDSERDVLAHLGGIVGHTIYAVEQRKALTSDTVTELEFRLNDVDHPMVEASSKEGVEVTSERLISASDGNAIQFATVSGMDAAEFLEAIEQDDSIERAALVSEGDEGSLLEVRTSETPITDALSGFGGRISDLVITDGAVRVLAELPPDADVRAVVTALESVSPGIELLAQRTETRDETTRQELQNVLVDRLTEKQRAALETAYFGGYFDWPRNHTGEEVAEMLGLSSATLAQHLRIAERKLFEALFASE